MINWIQIDGHVLHETETILLLLHQIEYLST